jgi:hypothetical protein
MSNIDQLLSQVTITGIFQALGGQVRNPDGKAQGQAFWRNSKDWNIRLYPNTNLWMDCSQGEHEQYSGILGLIQLVKKFDNKAQSVSWLEEYLGITPDHPKATREQIETAQKAKEWRDAMIALKQDLLERCDEAKVRVAEVGDPWGSNPIIEQKADGSWHVQIDETTPNRWREFCQQQKQLRASLQKLQALRGEELVNVYRSLPAETIRRAFANAKRVLAEKEQFLDSLCVSFGRVWQLQDRWVKALLLAMSGSNWQTLKLSWPIFVEIYCAQRHGQKKARAA